MKTLNKINTKTITHRSTRFDVVKRIIPADLFTPLNFYLSVRDIYPGSILLESADNQEGRNARSYVGFDPIVNITGMSDGVTFTRFDRGKQERERVSGRSPFIILDELMKEFSADEELQFTGYFSYSAAEFAQGLSLAGEPQELFRFSLYRFTLTFDHLRHTAELTELIPEGGVSIFSEALIRNFQTHLHSFQIKGKESADISEQEFLKVVHSGKAHCLRGDVFQVVLSRSFTLPYAGEDLQVYRALRMINPSPYLFYADFNSFRLMGSSPEALLVSVKGEAEIHPIAGTYRKTGDANKDAELADRLLQDPKENAEHVMLVDLARNDLSSFCDQVKVAASKEIHNYSHVMHLVSRVKGQVKNGISSVQQVLRSFPAGTLTGAPKRKAMELIGTYERSERRFYGGCIGMIGNEGSVNMAIIIRSLRSGDGVLEYRAGAGVVIDSSPESELQEINNKLGAIRKAIKTAEELS